MGVYNDKSYNVLTIPLEYNKSFLDCSDDEIKEYYLWFLKIKPIRLRHFCIFLFNDAGNCLNEDNLKVIQIFLINAIGSVYKTKRELEIERSKIPEKFLPYVSLEDFWLDDKTISICYDLGIYLGELIIHLDPSIKWKQQKDLEYADYGQPILAKKGIKSEINPFRVAKTIASKIIKNTYKEDQIIDFFKVWKESYNVG